MKGDKTVKEVLQSLSSVTYSINDFIYAKLTVD